MHQTIKSLAYLRLGYQTTYLILKSYLRPNGFMIYRKDRGSRGGGVMLAIENCLSSCQLQIPPNSELITVFI